MTSLTPLEPGRKGKKKPLADGWAILALVVLAAGPVLWILAAGSGSHGGAWVMAFVLVAVAAWSFVRVLRR